MSWNGHPVIDLDSHIVERADRFYGDYLDPAYRDAYQQLCDAVALQAEAGNGYSLFGSRTSTIEPVEVTRADGPISSLLSGSSAVPANARRARLFFTTRRRASLARSRLRIVSVDFTSRPVRSTTQAAHMVSPLDPGVRRGRTCSPDSRLPIPRWTLY